MLVVEVDLRRVYQKVNRPKRENVAKSGRDRRRSSHVCHVLPRDLCLFCRGALVPYRLAYALTRILLYTLTIRTHFEYTTSRLTSTIGIYPRWPAATPR